MVAVNELFTILGSAAGFISVAWNTINSRRSYIESLTPKLNVGLESNRDEQLINNTVNIENVGNSDVRILAVQFFAIDEGFTQRLHFGPAVYTTDLIIFESRILNRYFSIELPLSYDNFLIALQSIFGTEIDSIKKEITEHRYQTIIGQDLNLDDNIFLGDSDLKPAIFIRSAFLFSANLKEIPEVSKLPLEDLPPFFETILFSPQNYQNSRIKRSIDAPEQTDVFRMDWEIQPVFDINDSPLVTLTPTELGIPSILSPNERRNIDFQIPVLYDNYFRVKTILFVSKTVPKMLVFTKELTSKYQYYIRGRLR